jgi:hypothetical protein
MLSAYFCGQISTIAAKLGMKRSDFKLYIEGNKNFEEIENWGDHGKEEKEAILTALGAVHA